MAIKESVLRRSGLSVFVLDIAVILISLLCSWTIRSRFGNFFFNIHRLFVFLPYVVFFRLISNFFFILLLKLLKIIKNFSYNCYK